MSPRRARPSGGARPSLVDTLPTGIKLSSLYTKTRPAAAADSRSAGDALIHADRHPRGSHPVTPPVADVPPSIGHAAFDPAPAPHPARGAGAWRRACWLLLSSRQSRGSRPHAAGRCGARAAPPRHAGRRFLGSGRRPPSCRRARRWVPRRSAATCPQERISSRFARVLSRPLPITLAARHARLPTPWSSRPPGTITSEPVQRPRPSRFAADPPGARVPWGASRAASRPSSSAVSRRGAIRFS